MKHQLLAVATLLVAANVQAKQAGIPDYVQNDNLEPEIELMYKNEDSGLKQYDRGNFERAFELLSETAVQGLKSSQYILAFMFLKGEYVDKSILLGMGWLGVAKESKEEEWVELYDNMYARANEAQRAMIDAKVNQYIELYGLSATGVTCRRAQVTGSRRYEMRCIKSGGIISDPVPVETGT